MVLITTLMKEKRLVIHLALLLGPRRPLRYRLAINYPPEYRLCTCGSRKYTTAALQRFTELNLQECPLVLTFTVRLLFLMHRTNTVKG